MPRLLIAVLLPLSLTGCLFSPSKCGGRGVVLPGSSQYERYLANCRSWSDELDEVCRTRGKPVAIQIGSSGGYFAWTDPVVFYSVGAFGRTKRFDTVPKQLEPYIIARGKSATVVAGKPDIALRSWSYDDKTKKGVIVVGYAPGHDTEARAYAVKYIEEAALYKNITVSTGERPVNGRYETLSERFRDGMFAMDFQIH